MSATNKPVRMRNPFASGSPAAFFWTHGAYSYNPQTQTPAAGRKECAQRSADAERMASDKGYSFEWSIDDDSDSSSFKKGKPYALWVCICRDESGSIVSSLGAIDFGRDREPWGSPYRRVVEAELAIEGV